MLKSLSYLLLTTLVLTGCVFDNQLNCRNTTISFSYLADANEEVLGSYIDEAKLFIYDKNRQLVATENYTAEALLQLHKLNLAQGDYELVCWGNVKQLTGISSQDHLTSARINAAEYASAKEITGNDSLYFATQKIKVLGNNQKTHDLLKFQSAHIKLDVYVSGLSGLSALEDGDLPRLIISDLLPQYDFEMKPTQEAKTTYHPEMKLIPGRKYDYNAKLNVLRFAADNSIEIELQMKKNGVRETVAKVSLRDLLEKSPQDLSLQEITIPIHIQFKGTHLTIDIKEWKAQEIVPGLYTEGDNN